MLWACVHACVCGICCSQRGDSANLSWSEEELFGSDRAWNSLKALRYVYVTVCVFVYTNVLVAFVSEDVHKFTGVNIINSNLNGDTGVIFTHSPFTPVCASLYFFSNNVMCFF